MQWGKATLVEVNEERNVHKNVWQIVLFYFGISRETREMARLRTSVADTEKRYLEVEGKLQASMAESRIAGEQLATARAGRAYLTLGLVFYMFTHPSGSAFLVGLILLGAAHGNHLRRLVENLGPYVSQRIPQAIAYLVRLLECLIKEIRSGMRDWRWKSVLTSRNFNAAP
jgi:hypothetical protein